jgi:hypothetical protein
MGQYYTPIILGDNAHVRLTKHEYIRLFLSAHDYNNGMKLMEHSYLKNNFVSAFEYLISPEGPYHMSRVVWAGDYANNEPDSEQNLYGIALSGQQGNQVQPENKDTPSYRYIVNHTKGLYVDKNHLEHNIHPLPLLTAEGNGRGGGDYTGQNNELCGTWARDLLSVETACPQGYTELHCDFD